MKLICFHTSGRSLNLLDPGMCTTSSMQSNNGGLPGLYFTSTSEDAYKKNPQTWRNLIVSYQHNYGKFLHEFKLDLSRLHFSNDRLTITPEQLHKINSVIQLFPEHLEKEVYDIIKKQSKTDYDFLMILIHRSDKSKFDVKLWLSALSAAADFIASDKNFNLPVNGVLFVKTRPDTITVTRSE